MKSRGAFTKPLLSSKNNKLLLFKQVRFLNITECFILLGVIWGFRRCVNEILALLESYAA